MEGEVTRFRHAFLPPFLLSLVLVPVVVAAVAHDPRPDGQTRPITLLALALIAALAAFTLIWTRWLEVRVTPEGITCYDVSGRYRIVRWADIT